MPYDPHSLPGQFYPLPMQQPAQQQAAPAPGSPGSIYMADGSLKIGAMPNDPRMAPSPLAEQLPFGLGELVKALRGQ